MSALSNAQILGILLSMFSDLEFLGFEFSGFEFSGFEF